MSYLLPSEFASKMIDAGESKLRMAPRDVLLRAFMAGAILAIAVALAVTGKGANRLSHRWCNPFSCGVLPLEFNGI